MIFFFKPTYVFDKVKDITPDFLKKHGIKGLLLDLDNTLTTHNNPVVPQSSLDWIELMKQNGIKLMIVSNNHAPRVTPFAQQLGIDFKPQGDSLFLCISHQARRKPAFQVQESLRETVFAEAE